MLCCRPPPPLFLVDRFTHKSLSSLLSRSHSFPFKRRYFHSFLCVQFFYLEKLNQQKQDHGILSFPLVSVFFPWPKKHEFRQQSPLPFVFIQFVFVRLPSSPFAFQTLFTPFVFSRINLRRSILVYFFVFYRAEIQFVGLIYCCLDLLTDILIP